MRRRPKRGGGFLVGMAAGMGAGVAAGMWLLRPHDEEIAVAPEDDRGMPASVPSTPPARRQTARAAQRAPSFLDQLQQRWDLALREGRKAAAARRAELERKLALDRKETTVNLIAASHIDAVSETMGEIGGRQGSEG
jgi:hypothetical protein